MQIDDLINILSLEILSKETTKRLSIHLEQMIIMELNIFDSHIGYDKAKEMMIKEIEVSSKAFEKSIELQKRFEE